ncbi:MAG: CDP-alcohol phosphatidyltransferase family protein [Clostridia bacterium]|nr:CDP-alcohol phosphatidyltransferase family protein [Clostridia bacterium]
MDIRSKLNVPNFITSLRIVGAFIMMFTTIFTNEFYIIYTLCGITDVLDGFIARMTKKTTEFGAKLDSVADLLFYGTMLVKLLPEMLSAMPNAMPVMIASLLALRVCSYLIAAFRYKKFASLHTYMNKLSGFSCFVMPYLVWFGIPQNIVYSVVYGIAVVAGLEELLIHSSAQNYTRGNRTVITAVKDGKKDE